MANNTQHDAKTLFSRCNTGGFKQKTPSVLKRTKTPSTAMAQSSIVAITSQDDTHITASNITNQNGVMTGNNINLNAQNTLLNQSGDITAVNNLKLKAKTITNIASEQTITKGTNITQSVGSASNLQGAMSTSMPRYYQHSQQHHC
ncbi:hypothetical protein BSPWISOXPB_6147 [uncultured Gammaproteobacteria bacterium]|nr:hypothetical protein BSPWISOXPB_6147 [uncultured Gammaproteobacteria bacterium]